MAGGSVTWDEQQERGLKASDARALARSTGRRVRAHGRPIPSDWEQDSKKSEGSAQGDPRGQAVPAVVVATRHSNGAACTRQPLRPQDPFQRGIVESVGERRVRVCIRSA